MRLVQIIHPEKGRRIAMFDEPSICLIDKFTSIFQLALCALETGGNLIEIVNNHLTEEILEYDPIYSGQAKWRLLPAVDHPSDDMYCFLSGTGLTHKASAENRDKMHTALQDSKLTDSMKMYQLGVERGKPTSGAIGVQPEWFYKGNGSVLKSHGDSLHIPSYAMDGGEEPEIAGIYVNDKSGQPWRIGFAIANEFSDHVMESMNYLYLAPSKIRSCAIGPELHLTMNFDRIEGKVRIVRKGAEYWSKDIKSGEKNMAHSLTNLEHHHFKYETHRQPKLINIHFFGADAFSFGDGLSLMSGDEMEVSWNGMGRSLKNTLTKDRPDGQLIQVKKFR